MFIRQHKTPLAATPINIEITDRGYQIESIRRASSDFEKGKRKALIVMATGTGKTRVAMSLVDEAHIDGGVKLHVLYETEWASGDCPGDM